MLSAVVFDLDDTLVDQRTAARRAVVSWARSLGLPDDGVAQRWKDTSDRQYARYQRREITFNEQRRFRVRELLGLTLTDAEADELFAGYLTRYEAGWAAFDDAIPALRQTRAAGLTIAILTNGDEAQQLQKLDRLALRPEIDLMIASSSLPAGKPDPRAFEHTIERLGVNPDEALMVGDSYEKDYLGARAAGLQAVLLDRDDAHTVPEVPRIRSLHALADLLVDDVVTTPR
ncbi:HAD family hydrolase [Actinoplanes solisilvae]|uniref:HAD family hydrolase n=1 Tax=Actinoplanes solisilvae TaxID=2486853 RepID=UPI000FDAE53E|nr:HAD family hydrolase [Actinoplanes solisilvae]